MINLTHVLYIFTILFDENLSEDHWFYILNFKTDFKTGIRVVSEYGKTGITFFVSESFVLERSYYCSLGTNSIYWRTSYSTLIRMDMCWSWGVCSSHLFSFEVTLTNHPDRISWERSKPSVLTSDKESLSPKVA